MIMRQRIARLISNIFNPFLISFITIVILVIDTTASAADALKWTIIALVLSVIPVFAFIIWQIRRKKLDSLFPEGQGQRKLIYLLACSLAAVGCAVMWFFKAPELLTVSFLAGFVAVIIFMLINLSWKISLHTAFISAAAVVLTLVFGVKAVWVFIFLPLVGWSRLELKMHTLAQVIVGAILSAVIVTGIFWGFGVV
jgi:membrane-associated phospholipid phosphatase